MKKAGHCSQIKKNSTSGSFCGRSLHRVPRKIATLSLSIAVIFFVIAHIAWAQEDYIPVVPVKIITRDNSGRPLKVPSQVFYDQNAGELFVITGGQGNRLNVYDAEYFPDISLGSGRGIDAPLGVYVDPAGNLYICQAPKDNKKARLTILNPAFFTLREIHFDNIPGAAGFFPKNVTLGRTGNLYISGENNPEGGVLVFDKQGQFLRRIIPSELSLRGAFLARAKKEKESAKDSQKDDQVDEAAVLGLPPELQPRSKERLEEDNSDKVLGPVTVSDVATDSKGNLYFLSDQRGKVYVYDANEKFLFSFGQKGGAPGKLSRPTGFALDEKGNLVYVVDYMRHTVLVYSLSTGKFLYEFGGRGFGPGWFNFPISVSVDRDRNVIVADFFNNRVQVLRINVQDVQPLFDQGIDEIELDLPGEKTK